MIAVILTNFKQVNLLKELSFGRKLFGYHWVDTALTGTAVSGLFWRTINGAITAEHAAIVRFGFNYFTAVRTFPKKGTGINRHLFGLRIVAVGTRNYGKEFHILLPVFRVFKIPASAIIPVFS